MRRCRTRRSTRAADRADSERKGCWPPPGYLGRSVRRSAHGHRSMTRVFLVNVGANTAHSNVARSPIFANQESVRHAVDLQIERTDGLVYRAIRTADGLRLSNTGSSHWRAVSDPVALSGISMIRLKELGNKWRRIRKVPSPKDRPAEILEVTHLCHRGYAYDDGEQIALPSLPNLPGKTHVSRSPPGPYASDDRASWPVLHAVLPKPTSLAP